MGIESYHIPPGLQPECWTLPGLQWESGSPPDSGGNTMGRVEYRRGCQDHNPGLGASWLVASPGH